MSTPPFPGWRGLRRRLKTLGTELDELRRSLPLGERLLAGLLHGLRAVAAAAIGYWCARLLGLGAGFWAAITAISVTQTSYADVKNSSRDQVIGALIGGACGLAGAIWGHDDFLAYLLAVLVGMVACWVAKLGAAGRISGVTTTIVMLVPLGGSFSHIALMRLAEVALGVASALLVTRAAAWLEQRFGGSSNG
jgi:uncharacterized membrane protein YccC